MASRDDTSLLEDLIGDRITRRRALRLGTREYVVRRMIDVPPSAGLEVLGEHLYGTKIVWRGDGEVMFRRANSRDHLWRNFTVDVQGPLATAFRDQNDDPTGIIPSNNRHKRLLVHGNGRLAHYRVTEPGRLDANNEAHSDEDVHVNNAGYGWVISGQQAKYHVMSRCRFNGYQGGVAAVLCVGGSFSWLDGGGSHAADAFFRIRAATDTIAIHRADVDGAARFLHASGPHGRDGSAQPIEILGGRFMTHLMTPDAEGRLDAVLCEHAGPLTVRGFQLGSGHQPIARIAMRGFRGKLVAVGNTFGAYDSEHRNSFAYDSMTIRAETDGNVYHMPDGESYVA